MVQRHKSVKDVEKALSGGEPTWINGETTSISAALNWYNYHSDNKDSKNYALQYLKVNGSDKKELEEYAKINENHYGNLGFVCRIKTNGAPLTEQNEKWIIAAFESLKESQKTPKAKEVVEEDKPTTTVRDRIAEKAKEHIAELQNIIDECIASDDYKSFSPYAWMQKSEVKGVHTKFIVESFDKLKDELQDVVDGTDKQLVEGYSNFSKRQIKAFFALVSLIISDAEKLNDNAKLSRAPRKKKVKSANKVTEKLTYKKQDNEYKLNSINPVDIVGASQLWVFNTKTRKLGRYISKDADGFSVKGTTILNFNEEESIQKIVRKPEAVLENVLKGGKIVQKRILPELKTAEQPLTGRINADVILLRVIK